MAGRGTFTFSNADRFFDRSYGSSMTGLKLERLLQLTATWAGTTYPVFTGYIDRIGQTYKPPNEAIAVIEATDALKIMAGTPLPSSAYAAEVAKDTPRAWWRLDEPQAAPSIFDTAGGRTGTSIGTPWTGLGAAAVPAHEPDGAVAFTLNGSVGHFDLPGSMWPPSGSWTLEFWIQGSAANPNTILDTASSPAFSISVRTVGAGSGVLGVYLIVSGSTVSTVFSTVNVMDGQAHHVAIVGVPGSVLKIYVDTFDVTTVSTGTGVVPSAPSQVTYSINGSGGGTLGGYTLDELAVYPSALSSTRVQAHGIAGQQPWNNDWSWERIGRILDVVGVLSSDRLISAGGSTHLQAADLNMSALAHIEKVVEAEGGQAAFFVLRDGRLAFVPHDGPFPGTSKGILGDAVGELGYVNLSYSEDQVDIYNVVTRQRAGGGAQTVSDATSRADYWDRPHSLSGTLNYSDAEALSRATEFLARYKDGLLRPEPVTIDPHADEAHLFPLILDAELFDRYEVKRRPQGVGSAIDQALALEQTNLTILPDRWQTNWTLAPV